MGIFSTTNHFHGRPDNSVNIRFPDTIKVHEHKAPTDESIRLAQEMHEKVLDNIIAKVNVEDNFITGQLYLIDELTCTGRDNLLVVCKFKINGHEFKVERGVERRSLWDNENRNWILNIEDILKDHAKAILLWYTLKMFVTVAYEQLAQKPFPIELLPR